MDQDSTVEALRSLRAGNMGAPAGHRWISLEDARAAGVPDAVIHDLVVKHEGATTGPARSSGVPLGTGAPFELGPELGSFSLPDRMFE